jgi:hypothetical protein
MAFVDSGGDSFSAGDPPHGICVAFDDNALEPNPTWTRLDDPAGYTLASAISIKRGRDTEFDEYQIGTATVTLLDKSGILDSTNTGSPLHGKLKPNLQAAIARFNPVTGEWKTRFRGFIKAWGPYEIDAAGNIATMDMELVDCFDYIGRVEMTPADYGDPLPFGVDGDIYYRGGPRYLRQVNTRIIQILDDIGWPVTLQNIFSGNVDVQERVYARNSSPMEALKEAAEAEWPGIAGIWSNREGIFTFHGRFARFNPERPGYGIGFWKAGSGDVAAADATVCPISNPFNWVRDTEDVINRCLPLPMNVDDTDPGITSNLSEDLTSKGEYGPRSLSMENLITYIGVNDDGTFTTAVEEVKKYGQYYVDNYAQPKDRIQELTIRSRGPDVFSGPATWDLLNGIDLGDVLTLHTNHKQGGGFNEDWFVEGIMEEDRPLEGARHDVTMTLHISPRSHYDTSPFSGSGDNDDMADAFPIIAPFDGILETRPDNLFDFTNELDDPVITTSKDPVVQEFGNLYNVAQEYHGHDTFNAHNFATGWYRWLVPADWAGGSSFAVGVTDQSQRCCLVLCTIPGAAPPAHGAYTLIDKDHVALADTSPFTDLAATVAAGDVSPGDTVYIGVGVMDVPASTTFTLTWELNL